MINDSTINKQATVIVIADDSAIVREGMSAVLSNNVSGVHIITTDSKDTALETLVAVSPQLLIMSPVLNIHSELTSYCRKTGCKTLALMSTVVSTGDLCDYDAAITIFDSPMDIISQVVALLNVSSSSATTDAESLSNREREIVIDLVNGLNNKEISQRLGLSVNTVITHRRNILHKLKLHSMASLTLYAVRMGWVPL
ncbi:MAG: response regulator transcription factor [Muribaculaceae bacterium]|nr:response regulator transcription factor [Muribaculaceae bacterium]